MSAIEEWISGVQDASGEHTEMHVRIQSRVKYPLLPKHRSEDMGNCMGAPSRSLASPNRKSKALPNSGRKRQARQKPVYAVKYGTRAEDENDHVVRSVKEGFVVQSSFASFPDIETPKRRHGTPESDKENVAPPYQKALSWSTADSDSPIPNLPKPTSVSPPMNPSPRLLSRKGFTRSLTVPSTPLRPLPNTSYRRIGTPNGPFSVEPKRRTARAVGGSQKENLANIFKPMAERKNETLVELSPYVQTRRRNIPNGERSADYWDNDILPWCSPAKTSDPEGTRVLREAKASRIRAGPSSVTSGGKDVTPLAETTKAKVEAQTTRPPWRF